MANLDLGGLIAEVGPHVLRILGAILILVIGWIVAVAVRTGVKKGLGLIRLNEKIESAAGSKLDVAGWMATIAYIVVLLIALIAMFNTLQLNMVSGSLQSLVNELLAYLPNLIGGCLLLLLAWILATVLSMLATKALGATSLDEKLSAESDVQMSKNLGKVVYGLVILFFLPAVLDAFGLQGLLQPVQSMVDKIMSFLPNAFAAVVLAGVGWFVAGLVRNLVSNLLAAAGADKLGESAGLRGTMTLSKLIGLIVFIFVFVPTLIAALNALQVDAISTPATAMLDTFMAAIPDIFAAAVILALAFFVSRLISNLLAGLLGGLGFDALPESLGLKLALKEGMTPSIIAGRVASFFVMLFAVVEAAGVLGFVEVSGLVATFIEFGGQVLLGVAIIAIGLWIANLAHAAIVATNRPNSAMFAGLARITILGLVLAMGLRAMQIADEIVNYAFVLTLGAVAVAVALSFGLGGREAAGKQMEHWLSRMRGEN